MRAKRELEVAAGAWGLVDSSRSAVGLVAYAEEVQATKKTKAHLYKVMPYLKEFAGEIQLRAVDADWLERWKAFLLSRPTLAQITAAHYYGAVVHVLHRAVRAKIIARNPSADVLNIHEPEPIKAYLTQEEVALLAAHPLGGELGYEIYRSFLFACLVGLRVSDISRLTFGQIERKPRAHIIRRQQKTKEVVWIPVNDSALAIAGKGKAADLVFPRLSKSKTCATQYFRTWAKTAGVEKKIGWHMSRHTFAVRLLEEGVDIYTVSKLLGHRDLETTMAYAKATEGMKRKAVEALPEIKLEAKP
ncbi:MAG: tyrosine-type recombinase/integrase [Methylacidiphilaceae bacterium]|nr:tyrosine-type recombinase/integrase [Candidatus Methylacidiphilaceae bacterium]